MLRHNKIDDLFGLLSSGTRLQILKICSKKQNSISELSKLLKLPQYVISKHLNLLINESLIEKNSKTYSLSSYGGLILKKCACISFLNKNQKFFESHDFCEIPSQFIERIGNLNDSKLVEGEYIMFSHWTRVCNEAKKYIFCIFSYPPILISEPIKQKLKEGISIKFLFAKGSKNYESTEFVRNLRLHEHTVSQNLEKHRINKVLPNLIITEKESTLMFPDGKGSTDFHSNLISKNSEFSSWCLDFFNYEWIPAEPFSRFAKKSIETS
jgi:predicted transcriptional regulator